jgi:hypothetical protein
MLVWWWQFAKKRTKLRRRAGAVTIGYPLRNLVVPLLLGLALEETDDDNRHIVATHAACITGPGEAVVHQILTD